MLLDDNSNNSFTVTEGKYFYGHIILYQDVLQVLLVLCMQRMCIHVHVCMCACVHMCVYMWNMYVCIHVEYVWVLRILHKSTEW